jgi:DNA-directed RNA polymerase specialized sigma24 family protein
VEEAWGDFEAWYLGSHARLVASLLLVTGDIELTRDAVDEACARAFAKWRQVQGMESPTGWTFRVALNVVRRRQRRASMERRLLARRPAPPDVPPPGGEAWDVVRLLPPRMRTVVVLRYVADLTQVEIADVMGVTRSTVSSALADAHARLAELIGPELELKESNDV